MYMMHDSWGTGLWRSLLVTITRYCMYGTYMDLSEYGD